MDTTCSVDVVLGSFEGLAAMKWGVNADRFAGAHLDVDSLALQRLSDITVRP